MMMACFLFFSIAVSGQAWKAHADSATIYSHNKNTGRAIELYAEAKAELKKDSADTGIYARICDSLASLLSANGRFNEAGPDYLEAIRIQKKMHGEKEEDYDYSCTGLGIAYIALGQYDTAAELLLQVKRSKEKFLGKDDPGYATSCTNLGRAYFYMGEYKKAEMLFLETKQVREKILGKQHVDYAQACYKLASFYHHREEYLLAAPLYLEARQIFEGLSGKEQPDYINCGVYLTRMYIEMGDYEQARAVSLETKELQRKIFGQQDPGYAASCYDLGYIYYCLGEYAMAEPLYLEARSVREASLGKQDPDYAQSCISLAVLYRVMGQYPKAILLFTEIKQIQEKTTGKESNEYARSCNNIAAMYTLQEQYTEAEPLCLEAKKIEEKLVGNQDPLYADCCTNLAVIYQNTKQYEKAEALFREALRIKERSPGKAHPDYAICCNNLADLYANMGEYGKAASLYMEARKIREMKLGKTHPDYASSCQNLGTLYRLMQQPLMADRSFREAFEINAHNLDAVFQFTNEKEKTAFIKNILGEDDAAYSFYQSGKIASAQPYSMALFHRNLTLSYSQSLQKELFYSNDSSLVNKYNAWIALKKELSVLYAQPLDKRKEAVSSMEEKAAQLEKELNRLSEGFKKQQNKLDWRNVQATLHKDEASIEFTSFRFHNGKFLTDSVIYIALVIRKDKALPVLVSLFCEKKLTDLLSATGNKTANDAVGNLYASRGVILKDNKNIAVDQSVYSLIWKPLEDELKGIKTVYFAPSGILHRIAFAALPVNKREVLSDRYKLVQLTTTASVTDLPAVYINAADNLHLYGGIDYNADSATLKRSALLYAANIQYGISRSIPSDPEPGNSFNYLPGTDAEIKMIAAEAKKMNYHFSIDSGDNATEESFKALNGKASPAILHIATHGFFFADPQTGTKTNFQNDLVTNGQVFRQSDNPLFRSGLLFAGANNAWKGNHISGVEDGILTAYEVSNMYLPNTRLAVLSACETALGDIQGTEGVYGLQRSFKIAGVQNLLMSLWKVPDAETAEFMQLFYRNMFAGMSVSDAFYLTQSTMKNKYRSNPYNWAAWVLIR